jgi:hypothetical protein
MEKTIIRLLKLNFDLDDFYNISINPDYHAENITLQGHPSSEKLLKYTNLGYAFTKGENRLVATKDKIRIIFF